jgi:hypothetical protein
VIGFWRKQTRTEEEAILASLGRPLDMNDFHYAEMKNEYVKTGEEDYLDIAKLYLRRKMIREQYPADDQALLVEALDL